MSKTIQQKAEAALAEVEQVTTAILPTPSTDVVPLEAADDGVSAEIRTRMAELDMEDSGSIIGFGSKA
jgi:hypothetical protein